MVPPKRLARLAGGPLFTDIGQEFFTYLLEYAHLEPDDVVLDAGCGAGRIAIPLMSYLSHDGAYHGFDIVPEAIKWCTETISSRRQNFRFQLADLVNPYYNPDGATAAARYAFPYPSGSIDLVIATSVFTHMTADETERYLAETSRVLRPGGRGFLTWFILGDDSRLNIAEGRSGLTFQVDMGRYFIESRRDPGYAVALNEHDLRQCLERNGLRVQEPIHFGAWSGRGNSLTFQDVVVVMKGDSP